MGSVEVIPWMQDGHCVNKTMVAQVYQKVEMAKETCTNDCVVDISEGKKSVEDQG
jgi:hypothetical protein